MNFIMRQLQALLVAFFVFCAIVALGRLIGNETESNYFLVRPGLIALWAYWRGRRISLPAVHFCGLLYAASLCELGFQWVYGERGDALYYPSFNRLAAFILVAFALTPALIAGSWVVGKSFSAEVARWLPWLGLLLLLVVPGVIFPDMVGRFGFHELCLLFLSLPQFLLGLLSLRPPQEHLPLSRASLYSRLQRLRRRFRAMPSRRGLPLCIRMIQGWLVATYALFPGFLISVSLLGTDLLWCVLIVAVAARPLFKLGRWMRLSILCWLLTCYLCYSTLGYLLSIRFIQALFQSDALAQLGWRVWTFNFINTCLGFISGLASVLALLVLIACAVARRAPAWRLLKWLYTVAAVMLWLIVSAQALFLNRGPFSFWLKMEWSFTVMKTLLVLPPLLMTAALWLRDRLNHLHALSVHGPFPVQSSRTPRLPSGKRSAGMR